MGLLVSFYVEGRCLPVAGKENPPQSLRGESQQLRGVIFNSRRNSSHGDLFLLCYRMMAFGDRDLKRYFTKQG